MIEIASDALSATIDPHGAELASLRDADGRELMTDGDPAFWAGRAPLLFPIVGALAGNRYRLGKRSYEMPRHGFARRRTFALVAQEPARARFQLIDDAGTRAAYPFTFALDADFSLKGATLTMAITVTNGGDTDMPASFGFHPGFAWPLPYAAPRDEHRILFEANEPGALAAIDADGLIGSTTRPTPVRGRTLALTDDLFADDALVWTGRNSRSVRYGADAGAQLRIDFPEAPQLGIWTRPGARFVCIEPWWGHADPIGFDGEIWDKPGILRIAPGDARTFAMAVTLEAAPFTTTGIPA